MRGHLVLKEGDNGNTWISLRGRAQLQDVDCAIGMREILSLPNRHRSYARTVIEPVMEADIESYAHPENCPTIHSIDGSSYRSRRKY